MFTALFTSIGESSVNGRAWPRSLQPSQEFLSAVPHVDTRLPRPAEQQLKVLDCLPIHEAKRQRLRALHRVFRPEKQNISQFVFGPVNWSFYVSHSQLDGNLNMIPNLLTSPAATKEGRSFFSAPMVRALLDGSKMQTRRLYKNRNHPDAGCNMAACKLVREPQHVLDRMCPTARQAIDSGSRKLGPRSALWIRA
jgi:hypothetical protein